MSAEDCAKLMVAAIEKRQRLMLTSARSRFVRLLRIFAPNFLDNLVYKSIKERK
jgi:short-subunit dehydrogenase